jgi:hypothetical protein
MRRLLGAARWRARFFAWYALGCGRRRVLRELLNASTRAFDHPWVSDVTLVLRSAPGFSSKCEVFVDAPIVIVVWHKGRQSLFLACHVVGKTLTIEQLQGRRGENVPLDLGWTTRYVAACQEAARLTNLRRVRLVRAESLPTFRSPSVDVNTREEVEEGRARMRALLLRHYDDTAEQLGFTKGKWHWVWQTTLGTPSE